MEANNDGNIAVKGWRPRDDMLLYLSTLTGVAFILHLIFRVMVLAGGSVGVGAASVLQIFFLSIGGFAYSNYVTTRRPDPFLGRNGSLFDVGAVLFSAPFIAVWGIIIPDLHSHLYDSILCGFVFNVVFILGLHYLYLVQPGGLLDGSLRAGDRFGVGHAVKLLLILVNLWWHAVWCMSHGSFYSRFRLYLLVLLIISGMTWFLRKSHVLHLHHWFLGLLLTPCCAVVLPGALAALSETYSLALLGFSLSQFVEGSSRWGSQPIFERRQPTATLSFSRSRLSPGSAGSPKERTGGSEGYRP